MRIFAFLSEKEGTETETISLSLLRFRVFILRLV